MRVRGFTLMEMVIALAMAGIIGSVAVGAGMLLNATMSDMKKRAATWDETKRLQEALLAAVQEAGGDPLRPHQAVHVENNCGAVSGLPSCHGADRLTLNSIDPAGTCVVTGSTGANLDVADHGGNCCLTHDAAGVAYVVNPWEDRAAVFIKADGTAVDIQLHNVHGSCKINVPGVPGLGAGTLVAVSRRVIYPSQQDASTGRLQLLQWNDVGGGGSAPNGTAEPEEVLLLADNVYDFQVALGYDGKPEDGEVIDSGANNDEWVGNVPGDTLPSPITPDQLRMVSVGIVVGTRSDRLLKKQQVLDGGLKPLSGNIYVAAAQGSVMLRNLNISLP